MIGTPHTHQIIGGNASNATIASTDAISLATCQEKIDSQRENGWTANGTFERVSHIPNRFVFIEKLTTQTDGSVTLYYVAPKEKVVTALKPGFRSK
ncbi:hypothetical protein PMIN01_03338 [Paraphaeosphaeria minitans]|uniref:DUF1996 domain-containing protein n=1 Tax=Paraphaeosphaeria minitans TaxID=565426 RepID=A0A9P6KT99_9PLEO|nr:hypothetical protein PMIN01_03338 [Paraphaeosphaeria minitans]